MSVQLVVLKIFSLIFFVLQMVNLWGDSMKSYYSV